MKKLIVLAAVLSAAFSSCSKPVAQEYYLFDTARINKVEKLVEAGKAPEAYSALVETAQKALSLKPQSVTFKDIVPPSGDKHDYMSQGPYWWPNPKTPDGLPYIRKDGQHNPEINSLKDASAMGKMREAVLNLGLAYHFSGDEKYAAKATELLKTWFLDPETKMNPHLKFGQRIPGICDGRGVGLIDTHPLANMLNGVLMIRTSESWTEELDSALRAWFLEFATWMSESKIGKDEQKAKNNHGTYYDYQLAVYYMYAGQEQKARDVIESNARSRFDEIAADGSQPRELERTNGWGYSSYNLVALAQLATVAERLGIDLWNYVNPDGASLKDAIAWFMPYVRGEKEWDHSQINGKFSVESLVRVMLMTGTRYSKERYATEISQAYKFAGGGSLENNISTLVY